MELTLRPSLKIKQWVIGTGLPVAAIGLLVGLYASGVAVSWPMVAVSIGSLATINLLTLFFSKSWHKITNSIWKVTDEPTPEGWVAQSEVEKLNREFLAPHHLLEHLPELSYDYHKKSFSYYPNFAIQVVGFRDDYLIQVPKTLKKALIDSSGELDVEAFNAGLLHSLIRVALQENVWQSWLRICTHTLEVCIDFLEPLIKQYPLIEFMMSPVLALVNTITLHRDICYQADDWIVKLGHGRALKRFLLKASVPNHTGIAEICQKHPIKNMGSETLSPFSYPAHTWKHWVEVIQFYWHEWQQQAPATYLRLQALEAAGIIANATEKLEEVSCQACHPKEREALVVAFENRYTPGSNRLQKEFTSHDKTAGYSLTA